MKTHKKETVGGGREGVLLLYANVAFLLCTSVIVKFKTNAYTCRDYPPSFNKVCDKFRPTGPLSRTSV